MHIEQCVLTACIETKINGAWELDWFLNARISSIVLFVMHVRATQESVDWKKCATASTFNEGCFQCIWVLFCWPCLLYHEWTFHMSFKIQFTLWGRRMRTCITDWKTSRRHWENWGNCFWITRMVRIMSNERLLIINMKTWVGVCMQFSILFKDFFWHFIKRVYVHTASTVDHDSDQIHAWNEWIKNGKMHLFSTINLKSFLTLCCHVWWIVFAAVNWCVVNQCSIVIMCIVNMNMGLQTSNLAVYGSTHIFLFITHFNIITLLITSWQL